MPILKTLLFSLIVPVEHLSLLAKFYTSYKDVTFFSHLFLLVGKMCKNNFSSKDVKTSISYLICHIIKPVMKNSSFLKVDFWINV